MAITLTSAVRTSMVTAIVTLVDAGTPPGNLQVATSAFASILATFTLNNPAFGTASAGAAALGTSPALSVTAANTGTAAVWRIRNAANTTLMSGTTTTSATGADLTLDVTLENAGLNAINTAIGASGKIQFTTAGDTTFASPLATLPLNATAFASASSGSMVMNVSPAPTANAGSSGTATLFRFTNNAGSTEIFRGSVGTSGTDLVMDTNIFGSGVPVTVSALTLTLPATDSPSVGTLIFNTLSLVSGGLVTISSGSFTQN